MKQKARGIPAKQKAKCVPVQQQPSPREPIPAQSPTEKNKQAPGETRSISYLALAAWFGLVTGFGELAFLAVRVLFQKQVIYGATNQHLPWLTMLAEFIVFGAIGIALFLIGWRWPRLVPLQLACFLFALPCVFSLRAVFTETSWYAWAVLNIGAAVGISRLLGYRPERTFTFVRRSLFVLVPAAVALSLYVYLAAMFAERRASAALPPAAPTCPNVLLLVLDTVRAQSMSLHGYRRATTPRLEEWARRGVCFDRAVAPSSWTLPSHATFFTGHMPHEMFHDWSRMSNHPWQLPMDDRFPTLAELFSRQGYRTAGFVANRGYGDRVFGLNRGFAHYEDMLVFGDHSICLEQVLNSSYLTRLAAKQIYRGRDAIPIPVHKQAKEWAKVSPQWEAAQRAKAEDQQNDIELARKDAVEVNREFLSWLEKNSDRPFFAFLNYMDAHDPYEYRDELAGRLASMIPGSCAETAFVAADLVGMAPRYPQLSLTNLVWLQSGLPGSLADSPFSNPLIDLMVPSRLAYETSLAYLDQHVGALLDEIESRDLLRSTLIIVTSDHGDQFGEHGMPHHGNTLYMQLLHVPLIVLCPGRVPTGVRVPEAVSLANLPATILDVAKAGTERLPGKSLARFWVNAGESRPNPDPIYSDLDIIIPDWNMECWMRSVVDGGYHYIVNRRRDGTLERQELYHWAADPHEKDNLIASPEHQDIQARVKELLRQYEIDRRSLAGTRDLR
jgi:arylsulfatase A-like enzyme